MRRGGKGWKSWPVLPGVGKDCRIIDATPPALAEVRRPLE